MNDVTYLLIALAASFGAVTLVLIAVGFRPLILKKDVLVVLRSGETLQGVLVGRRPSYLILDHAALISDGTATQIDGHVHVDRDNVTWVQVP